jgi:predicted nuclease with RNAse H fold
LRFCDRELLRRGIRFFPVTLGAMRSLTERGIRLKERLQGEGFRVVEVFPGGAQDVLGLPRKHHNLDGLREGLRRLGLRGIPDDATHDELDAVTAAYVGWLFLRGKAEVLGEEGDGIVMPLPSPFIAVKLKQRTR